MKRLISLLLVIVISVIIHAQFICMVHDRDYENHLHDRHSSIAQYSGPYHVNVFFHIIRDYDGNDYYSFPLSDLSLCLQRLNNDFNPLDITFDSLGMDYIDSQIYYRHIALSDSEYHSLMYCQFHSNAIDIYLLPLNSFPKGLSEGIPGRALAIGGIDPYGVVYATSHVLSHEIGHCLGLFHTFHGANTGGCNELVNGSNCDICGDYVCDTPADPYDIQHYSAFPPDCIWTNTALTDTNNQLYIPDTKQIMSYTQVDCMEHFSAGQGDRMIEHMLSEEILEDRTTPSIAYIQNLSFSDADVIWAYDSIVIGKEVTSGAIGEVELLPDSWLGLTAGRKIVFKPGFKVHLGAELYTEIDNDCFQTTRKLHRRQNLNNDYLPLLDNSSWASFLYTFESPDYVSVYTNTGDTLIGNKSYRVIKKTVIDVYIAEMERSKVDSSKERTWYLYEDKNNKRVYYYNAHSQTDDLLYDFSLQIGDTHPVYTSFTLESIAPIINSGYERRQLTFTDSHSNKIIWIEGIGNSVDMIDPSACKPEGDPSKIICVKNGENTVYDTGGFYGVTCEFIHGILDENMVSSLNQEFTDNHTVATKLLRDGQLLIQCGGKTYNARGQEVK